ncbi:MAG TPA: tyrosine-type recombinase/integrase [Acidimicrobiales bacterium]|nr:tyrosine-type recombinase/integrase [Acidimicrobiales bacterium]
MGYISKRSGKWQAAYRAPDGRERTATFDKKVDAQRWINTNQADMARGVWIDPKAGEMPFRVFAEGWLADRPDLRPRTVTLYRSLLRRHLLPAFGDQPLASVSSSAVARWHTALKVKHPGAAASSYRLLRAIFATAVRDEKLVRSPCRVPSGATDRAAERPMLTVAQVDALTDAMPAELRAAVVLAAWGGLRRGEILGLRRSDIDPLRSQVRIERAQVELNDGSVIFGPPKTEAGTRSVHLPDHALAEIEHHLEAHVGVEGSALLFTGRGGVPMRPRTLAAAFRAARSACRLGDVHFHDLRHFNLTLCAAAGATTRELMRRGGHASPAAALRYQHATEDRDKAIADALSALVSGADVVPISEARSQLPRTRRGQGGR